MLIVMPLNALMARVQQRMQRKLMAARDERVKVFNEVINGIKIIKMYAWETGFKEKIETTRAEEIRLLRNYRAFRIVSEMMWSAGEHTTTCEASSLAASLTRWRCAPVPVLVSLSSFAAYTLMGEELTPAKAFTSLALFNILRFPMAVLPSIISQCVEAFVSVGRILKFLKSAEVDPRAVLKNERSVGRGEPAVTVPRGCSLYWDDEGSVAALRELDLRLEAGVAAGEVLRAVIEGVARRAPGRAATARAARLVEDLDRSACVREPARCREPGESGADDGDPQVAGIPHARRRAAPRRAQDLPGTRGPCGSASRHLRRDRAEDQPGASWPAFKRGLPAVEKEAWRAVA